MSASTRSAAGQHRRDFLRACAVVAGGAAIASLPGCGEPDPAPARRRGTLLATGRFSDEHERMRHTLTRLDLDRPDIKLRYLELPFFPHGIAIDPRDSQVVVLFEKKGKGSCRVDLRAGEIRETISTVASREFYGHGVFSTDGSLLYCTETDLDDDHKGILAVRETEGFKLVGAVPTYGTDPHDCRMIDGGRTLVVANSGDAPGGAHPPSVTYIDVASEKLIDELRFDTPRIGAGHLDLTGDGDLAVVSAPRRGMHFDRGLDDLGGVSLRPRGGNFTTMSEPRDVIAKMLRETLSVAIHPETSTVGVTNPAGNIVTFWDLRESRFLSALEIQQPYGLALTLDHRDFLVSYGGGTKLAHIDARSRQIQDVTTLRLPLLTGSHIVVHDLPTA